MHSVLKVIAIIALIWVGFIVLGAVLKMLVWVLVIGGAVFLGTMAYAALKNRSDRPAIRR